MGKQYLHVWKHRGGSLQLLSSKYNEDSDIKTAIEEYWIQCNSVSHYNHTIVLDYSRNRNTFEIIDITKEEGFDDV